MLTDSTARRHFYTGLLFAWRSNCTLETCNPDTAHLAQLEKSTSVLEPGAWH